MMYRVIDALKGWASSSSDTSDKPTIFHVTQHKCGSQWVAEVLKWSAADRFVLPQEFSKHFTEGDLKQGFVYPTVYLDREEFYRVLEKNSHIENMKIFVVIRDLRDILISLYFSFKNSHPRNFKAIQRFAHIVESKDLDDALIYLIDTQMRLHAARQSSWMNDGCKIVRYEELIENENEQFRSLLSYLEINRDSRFINRIIEHNSFVNVSGRKTGVEDVSKHQRKGISGDWENYFSIRVKDYFKEQLGQSLIETGYEVDLNW